MEFGASQYASVESMDVLSITTPRFILFRCGVSITITAKRWLKGVVVRKKINIFESPLKNI